MDDITIEKMSTNKKFIVGYTIIGAILAFSMVTSQRDYSITFRALCLILIVLPWISCIISYRRNPAGERLPFIIGYSFMIFYAYLLFATSNPWMYTYIMPMLVYIQMYQNSKLSKRLGLLAILINILDVVGEIAVKRATVNLDTIEEFSNEIFNVVVFVVFSYISSQVTEKMAEKRFDKVQKMHEKLSSSIKDMDIQISYITDSSMTMKDSMIEVNGGIASTVDAVQSQLAQTEAIQQRIEIVSTAADAISKAMSETMNYINEGNKGVGALVNSADISVGISGEVSEKLNKLQNNMGEMNEITKLIDNIAFQTNIMALNANVEASRAGEAGRGFAVVASEISNMSAKTKEATQKITDQITNVSNSLNELSKVIEKMMSTISEERQNTENTASAFLGIKQRTDSVQINVEELASNISALNTANKEIVASVKTISETSDNVSYRTNELMELELSNADALQEVAKTISELASE